MRRSFSIFDEVVRLSKISGQGALWTTGLMNRPLSWLQPPSLDAQIVWHKTGDDGACFSNTAYGDGSWLYPRYAATRRCGWAVAGSVTIMQKEPVESEGEVGSLVFPKALPGLMQEVPLAEVYAFIMAITHSLPDDAGCFTYYIDCKWVVDSFEAGWSRCTSADYVGAVLWIQLFRVIDGRFVDARKVFASKVKAHSSVSSCVDCRSAFGCVAGTPLRTKEPWHEQLFTPPTSRRSPYCEKRDSPYMQPRSTCATRLSIDGSSMVTA